jgi:hypothetical protein
LQCTGSENLTIILVKAQDSRIPRQPEERQKTARLPLQIVNQHARFGFTVIDGAAPGADTLAYEWASERGLACKRYPADWTRHGRAAGPLRDAKMMIEGSRTSWLHFRAAAGLRTWFGGPAPQMLWLSMSGRRILMTSVSELEERVATLQRQLDDVREALLLFAAEAAPYDHERGIKFPDHMLAWDSRKGGNRTLRSATFAVRAPPSRARTGGL